MNTVHKLEFSCKNPNRLLRLGLIFFIACGNAIAGDVKLAWNASTSTGIGGYKLFIGPSSNNYTSSVDVGNVTAYTATGLTNGAKYFFALKTYNAAKSIESSFSSEVSATVSASTTTGVSWTLCANENQSCTVSSTREVRFGTSTAFVTGVATGSVPCTNAAFGKDPAVTIAKQCWVSSSTTTAAITVPVSVSASTNTSWTVCAKENQTCSVSGKREVRYGTSTAFMTGVASGSVPCTNKAFGKDPAYGIGKTCWVSSSTTTASLTVPVSSTTTANNTTSTNNTTTSFSGLVAAYGFEDFGGAITADASGQGNHGTISEATRISTGYFGRALKFDGVNDLVTVNDSASLDLTNGMTLEAWLYPEKLPNAFSTAIMKESATSTVYNLNATNYDNLPGVTTYDGATWKPTDGSTPLPLNTWSHLVATYDGINQRLYVNGIQVAVIARTGLIQQSSGSLRIGGNSIWGDYFTGRIDEVRIYNRALTSAEISTDYRTAISVSNPANMVIGNNTLESKVDSTAAGQAEAFKTTSQKASALQALQIYLDSSSVATELVAGVYADNAGHPGTLLTQGKINSPQAGKTNTVPINSIKLAANTTYWIAILGPTGKGDVKFRVRGGATNNPMETSGSKTLTSLPSQWSTGTVYASDGPMSAYGSGY